MLLTIQVDGRGSKKVEEWFSNLPGVKYLTQGGLSSRQVGLAGLLWSAKWLFVRELRQKFKSDKKWAATGLAGKAIHIAFPNRRPLFRC